MRRRHSHAHSFWEWHCRAGQECDHTVDQTRAHADHSGGPGTRCSMHQRWWESTVGRAPFLHGVCVGRRFRPRRARMIVHPTASVTRPKVMPIAADTPPIQPAITAAINISVPGGANIKNPAMISNATAFSRFMPGLRGGEVRLARFLRLPFP
jgi:hypothetical protein